MDLPDKKNQLRRKVIEKRDKLSENEWKDKSRSVFEHFRNSDVYLNSSVLHTYVSMKERKEVDTSEIIEHALSQGKRVIVPVMEKQDNSLEHAEINSDTEWKTNSWGVPEPEYTSDIDLSSIDLVVVPLLAADKSGNRLGYGKGYYDRFLSKLKAFKLGLVFGEFIFEEIPTESFDVPLDGFISELGVQIV